MSTHTPGPWHVSALDARTVGPSRLLVSSQGGEVPQLQAVAIVTLRTGETDANARLIAAAPDLLAACLEAYAWIAYQGDDLPASAVKLSTLVRAAITKAEGR